MLMDAVVINQAHCLYHIIGDRFFVATAVVVVVFTIFPCQFSMFFPLENGSMHSLEVSPA